ncbi:hypothetical protein G7K_2571-t1 [Saitoella complicata NRRL Y-17804]|uniref:Uncharacterized protein n=1 Tax=Saitoella complicata (strain BCRC 22490 / CBS 7301 / JCM 7358 / NBRC 10748 / NRRL Y-17804) TaxID=698492 RepID=A0A0E9NF16_SAICN|nr:hypothetical protein G7K_2571-t1 [Saitoella complicata NRRL Y-17804]
MKRNNCSLSMAPHRTNDEGQGKTGSLTEGSWTYGDISQGELQHITTSTKLLPPYLYLHLDYRYCNSSHLTKIRIPPTLRVIGILNRYHLLQR